MDIVWLMAGGAFFAGSYGLIRFFGSSRGGLTVDWTLILALVMSAGLVVYLTAALLKPEKF